MNNCNSVIFKLLIVVGPADFEIMRVDCSVKLQFYDKRCLFCYIIICFGGVYIKKGLQE